MIAIDAELPAGTVNRWSYRGRVQPHLVYPDAEAMIAAGEWTGNRLPIDFSRAVGYLPELGDGNGRISYLCSRGHSEMMIPVRLIMPDPNPIGEPRKEV